MTTVEEVAPNVFRASGTDVNVVILRDGGDLTLIDGGYPGDVAAVENAIRSLGRRPEDVRAMLLTHAHVDHMGALVDFHRRFGIPVLTDPVEVAHARRDYLEQATPKDFLPMLHRRGVLPWLLRIARVGATKSVSVDDAVAFTDGVPLDVPGAPVPVPTHGHTSGHSAFHLPQHGVLVTGDALITAHPLSKIRGPQLLPEVFDHGHGDTLGALENLAVLDAGTIVPGHGPTAFLPIADAVEKAQTQTRDHRHGH
ncbi:MBL fold metallo-hydrolase [Rhodococcus sp. D2-41]|uniref:MBL fold metallo-hydrolase n=1 Tax=Speluncibacter jeojiensis TaxID=2710754 RepID=UPI00240EC55E|nr:MBL fold metallo-hydrolase [Rhodococcus sp. D2-41]MDG3010228.1 MBL fold metallo-hydrolase [Rhodococcus sp. D2-41]